MFFQNDLEKVRWNFHRAVYEFTGYRIPIEQRETIIIDLCKGETIKSITQKTGVDRLTVRRYKKALERHQGLQNAALQAIREGAL